ncbi:MAG TPA: COX15/CtaA family protein [Burkholderiales bacterium]|jgi:cytochrome c oxidase assembly protein subunit 15|nr:COX15/CtaA family protein [Burkholderiales bacterium]
MTDRDRSIVAAWLFVCAALAFAVVLVGGITRLTRSGLSIVEWQPLIGIVPPLSAQDWEALFARYRETPEFRQLNPNMTLEGFKGIFWWEYTHRLLARVIGIVYVVPLLFFQWRKMLERSLAVKLWAIFVLGALQGVLGWYMVKSGLIDDPQVSPVRLSAHLGLALVIFAAELWIALQLLSPRIRPFEKIPLLLPYLVLAMAVSGGMVAGLRAGYAYNTFPLMNGELVPPDLLTLEPWWRNFLYNMASVQFLHRAFFWLIALLVLVSWWPARHRAASHVLLLAFAAQAALGILTLLNAVPLPLAVAHQSGAVVLLAAALWNAHSAGTWPAQRRIGGQDPFPRKGS